MKKTHFVVSVFDVEVAESEVGVQREQEAHLVAAETLVALVGRGGVAGSGKFLGLKTVDWFQLSFPFRPAWTS